MNEILLQSILAISLAVNIFVAMYCIANTLLSSSKILDHFPNILWRLHEEHPWYLPRYLVLTFGHVVVFLIGIGTLCATDVIQTPFCGLPWSVQVGFSIFIGFYIFKLSLDSIYHVHFTGQGIPTVHHILTVTLYMLFVMKQQNGLCGVLGMVFQFDAMFIDTSKLLSELKNDDHELTKFLWANKCVGTFVTFLARLLLPSVLIIISLVNDNIFTMDLIVVMFYFLSLVFFSVWNLLMFYNAVIGFVRFYYLVKRTTYQRALGVSLPVTRQEASVQEGNQIVPVNNLRRLTPLSNNNIMTNKQKDWLNNLKTPKIPIREAIRLEHVNTGESSVPRPTRPRQMQTLSRDRPTSDYDPTTNSEECSISSVHLDGMSYVFDTTSHAVSDSSISENDGYLETHRASVAENTYFRHQFPPNIHHSYTQLNAVAPIEMDTNSPDLHRHQRANYGNLVQTHSAAVFRHSQERPQAEGEEVTFSSRTYSNKKINIYSNGNDNDTRMQITNDIEELTVRTDMSKYPQFGERQSI